MGAELALYFTPSGGRLASRNYMSTGWCGRGGEDRTVLNELPVRPTVLSANVLGLLERYFTIYTKTRHPHLTTVLSANVLGLLERYFTIYTKTRHPHLVTLSNELPVRLPSCPLMSWACLNVTSLFIQRHAPHLVTVSNELPVRLPSCR
ncbi:hypothetical protein J6590_013427 [Homalodisca vitripennis]|nr:hypothetical protein J6590_013427 [Homalodisca vitripennis]